MKINLPDIVGRGYATFWNSKHRYRVVKGSRASKKSKTIALWLIFNLMKPEYKDANAVVFRKTYRTLKDSCYSDLRWAIKRLSVDSLWRATVNPLELTYTPTGQRILFRGLDDPLKITSLSVPTGYLTWFWLEEAYELTDEDAFNMLDESLRGEVPKPLFKGWIISLNPWNERHWIKRRFFDTPGDDTLALTTNYKINEWLDQSDLKLFEDMRLRNPRRYQVAGLGEWGVAEGLVYENYFDKEYFTLDDIPKTADQVLGLDFGYTNDPTALFVGYIDTESKTIWVTDELYEKGLANEAIYKKVVEKGYQKAKIKADSAEPKSIDELKGYGLRVSPTKKGKDSIMNGIQFIQSFTLRIHPNCVSFITEISSYAWDKDKLGNTINRPIDDFNHLMDAMRYAVEDYTRKRGWLF